MTKLNDEKLKQYEKIILDENVLFELNAIPQMIVNKDRVIIRANKKFTTLFGYTNGEILGQQTVVLTPTKEKFHEYAQYFKETKEGIIKSEELEYKKQDGTIFWVKLEGNRINQQEEELLILWSFLDVDKEVKYREELKQLASTDPMTKLLNRRSFYVLASKIMDIEKRENTKISLLMLDIDKFKNVNDTFGHSVGDDVIVKFAQTLQEMTRKSDLLCRWGGEEFVALLPNTSIDGGYTIAQKIRKSIASLSILLENQVHLSFTVSIGIIEICLQEDESIDSAISRADFALYEAKENGRNRVIRGIKS
jgi:diguanylate cyclase (GGDEF)-like protein/PAS domain S-box-containing protein